MSKIYTRKNEKFCITLPYNASTGYTYEIKTKGPVKIINKQYMPSTKVSRGLIGAGGTLRYTLQATGNSLICVLHGRMWDKSTITSKIYKIIVKV